MTEPAHDARIVGRSSSHFTRIARLFAAEHDVAYVFDIVRDLRSLEVEQYGGNPALRIPVLHAGGQVWFGALPICRALAQRSSSELRVAWPEDLHAPLLANMQELTLQAMSTEVALIMAQLVATDARAPDMRKPQAALRNVLAWLEQNLHEGLATLPRERDLSYLEVALFCLVDHLAFREVVPVRRYPALVHFAQRFGKRASALATPFRFDA